MIAKIHYWQLNKFLVVAYDHIHFDNFYNTAILVCSSISIITDDWEW